VIHSLKWPEYELKKQFLIETWQEVMITECMLGDSLHIRRVYEHMDYILAILRQGLPVDSFCDELEERRKNYA
jgi:hypothetical protein